MASISRSGCLVSAGIGNECGGADDLANLPFSRAYKVMAQLSPMILEAQEKGTIGAAWLNKSGPQMKDLDLGGYTVNVNLTRNRRAPDVIPEVGYGLVIATGPDEFWVSGNDVQVTFLPRRRGRPSPGWPRWKRAGLRTEVGW